MLGVVLVGFLACAGVAVALKTSEPKLTSDPAALAKLDLPLGGGTIESVSVVAGPHNSPVPVDVSNRLIWPTGMSWPFTETVP